MTEIFYIQKTHAENLSSITAMIASIIRKDGISSPFHISNFRNYKRKQDKK
jgi:hypothetical protein